MQRPRGRLSIVSIVLIVFGMSAAACGQALAIDDELPTRTPDSNAAQGDGAGTLDGTPDASADTKPACATKTVVVGVKADTGPPVDQCDGANGWGARSWATLSPSVACLFARFDLPAEAASAIRGGELRGARLELTANPTCFGSCDVPSEKGTLQVHAMRNDWDEGTLEADYSGADKCRRTSGQTAGRAWGAGDTEATGASAPIAQGLDYLGPLGTQSFPDKATSVSIALAHEQLAQDWNVFAPSAAQLSLSFYVVATAGKFVAHTNGTTLNGSAATLSLEYCVPDGG